ncbi:MAG: PAS domain-containing protein [Rhodospirillales bacterium]|nr:PAS domain-containing protein [Rhodospirillales bacterium]
MGFRFDRGEIGAAPAEMQAIFAYWDELRGERFAPTLKEFDLLHIPSAILPHSIVIDYIANDDSFIFRFFGSEVVRRHGEEMTGRSPRDFKWASFGEALEKEYRGFIGRKQPEYLVFGFRNENGTNELHKVLRLPLSNDAETVTGIVAILIASVDSHESRKFFENQESCHE